MSCSPYFNLNTTTAELEYKILSVGELLDIQNDAAKLYDQTFLLVAISDLNSLVSLANPDYSYPMLYDRLAAGPIGLTEYAEFLVASGTTQDMVEALNSNQLTIAALQYLENLNTHYTKHFSSSTDSFCTIFSGIMDKIFSLLQNVNNVIGAILNIKNLINTLIDTIKEKMMSTVNQLIGQVNTFIGSIKGIVSTVQKAADFFSDMNIKKLKGTVDDIIASTANKFANITPQNIEYLVYRFCQLSGAVEQFMRAPVEELQNLLKNGLNIKNILTNASNAFSLDAVMAGGFRMSDLNIAGMKEQLAGTLNNGSSSPTQSPSNNGQSGGATPGKWYTRPFSDAEKSAALAIISASDEQIKSGSHPGSKWFDFSGTGGMDSPFPSAGVKNLTVDVLILGMRISERLGGKKLIINSAYRSPAYNAGLSSRTQGVAKNSFHMSGMALDVSRSSFGSDFESGENFIKIASQEGAMGMSAYPTFVHIDVRSYRSTWATGAEGKMKHLDALKLHMADQFRVGNTPVTVDQSNPTAAPYTTQQPVATTTASTTTTDNTTTDQYSGYTSWNAI